MGTWSDTFVSEVVKGLDAAAAPADIQPMTAYMRNQFPFLGVGAPGQRAAVRVALAAAGQPVDEAQVVAAIDALWSRPQREHRYCGCQLAARFASSASPGFLGDVARWIATDPWWDTCDSLARNCAGRVTRRHPSLRQTMDEWLGGDNPWLTRGAIIHMGGWKDAIEPDWVFAACLARAADRDFFIRKAIGWILRDLASVNPDIVTAFVDGPGAGLSMLSKREALRNVDGAARPGN